MAAEVKVAIVTDTPDASMVAQLKAELTELGVRPVVVDRTPPDDIGPIIREVGGVGAIALDSEWMVIVVADDRGHSVRFDVAVPTDLIAQSQAGVRAIEMLRAGLIEIHADHITRGVDATSLTLVELAALGADSNRLAEGNYMLTTLNLGTEVAAGDLGAAPVVNLVLGIAYGAGDRADVTLVGSIPMMRARYSDQKGEAVFGLTTFDGGGAVHLADPDGAWVPTLGAGIGLIFLRVSGEAVAPFNDETVRATLFGPYGRWGLSYWPGGPIRIRGDLHVSVSQKAAIFFVNREVGAWGPVQTGLAMGFEVDLR